jgi:hypothetical protein
VCLLLYCAACPETPFFFVSAARNILRTGISDWHNDEFQFQWFFWKQVIQERSLFESKHGNNKIPGQSFSNQDKRITFEVASEQDFKDMGNALLSLAVYHTLHSLDVMLVKEQDAIYASCHSFLTNNIPYLGVLKANRYLGMLNITDLYYQQHDRKRKVDQLYAVKLDQRKLHAKQKLENRNKEWKREVLKKMKGNMYRTVPG